MKVTSAEDLEAEYISPWTHNVTGATKCGGLTCGGTSQKPKDYLADTQDEMTIVVDPKVGPVLIDNNSPCDLDTGPGVLRSPRVV